MNPSAPVQLSLVPSLSIMPVMPAKSVEPISAAVTRAGQESSLKGAAQAAPAAATAELQHLITQLFLQEDPAQHLLAVSSQVPEAHRSAWHLVTHTLLARRLALSSPAHLRHAADAHCLAWGLARQWDQPVLLQRWQRLVNRLTGRQCQQLVVRLRRQLSPCAPHSVRFRGDAAPLDGGARLLQAGASCH